MVAALVLSGLSHASAQGTSQMITCWYNANGAATGWVSAQMPATLGLTQTTTTPGYNYFGYNIWAPDGTSCPSTMVPGATKICSAYAGGSWRALTPVPFTWTVDDCVALNTPIGGDTTQLGCFFQTGASKFSWGQAAATPNKPTAPNPNCGW